MHDNLFPIRNKDGDPVVLWVLLETFFSLKDTSLNLLKAAQINLVEDLVLNLFEVFFFKLDLLRDWFVLFIIAINFLFVNRNEGLVQNIVSELLLIPLWVMLLICVLNWLRDSALKI